MQENQQNKAEIVMIQGSNISLPNALKAISDNLKSDLKAKESALPKGFSRDRFVLNTETMLKSQLRNSATVKSFANVTYNSIIACFEKAAFLGLDFFNGECYAIPYGKSLQFQTDYKGELKLCKAYSTNPILNIFAKVVREGDEYSEEVIDGDQRIIFKPKPFSNGEIIGAFAIVKYKDGSMAYDSMSIQEIESIRQNYSRAKDSPAWKNSYGEMCKKTVLRRLSKMIDKNFNADQLRAYEDGGDAVFHSEPPRSVEVIDSNSKDLAKAFNESQSAKEQVHKEDVQKDVRTESAKSSSTQNPEYEEFEQYENAVNDGTVIDSELPFR